MATSKLRYLAPNLVTTASIIFGLVSMIHAHQGDFVNAAWFIIWAGVLDRLDGLVARSLNATSEFGLQMDSFADLFNFGVAPAFLIYFALGTTPEFPFSTGAGHTMLVAATFLWIAAAAFRLARFNVLIEKQDAKHMFFGIPTTFAAGMISIWFLFFCKYVGPENPLASPDQFHFQRLFGFEFGPGSWKWFVGVLVFGAVMMVSNVRMAKFGALKSKGLNLVVIVIGLAALSCGILRILPEIALIAPTTWFLIWLIWSPFSPAIRAIKPPPVFPVKTEE